MSDKGLLVPVTEEEWKPFSLESFDSVSQPPAGKDVLSEFCPVISKDNGYEKEFFLNDFDNKGNAGNNESNGKDEMSPEKIIEEAKKKSAAIESEAYEKGFAQGEKDGLEMGIKKNEKVLEDIEGVLKGLIDARTDIIKKYEEEILRMIDCIARKVIGASLPVNSNLVRETILKALELALDRNEITVKVSPDDFDYVKEIKGDFFERIEGLKSMTVISDSSVSRGGCYVETHLGDIDARLERQVDSISASVRKVFEDGLSED